MIVCTTQNAIKFIFCFSSLLGSQKQIKEDSQTDFEEEILGFTFQEDFKSLLKGAEKLEGVRGCLIKTQIDGKHFGRRVSTSNVIKFERLLKKRRKFVFLWRTTAQTGNVTISRNDRRMGNVQSIAKHNSLFMQRTPRETNTKILLEMNY